MTDTAGDKSAAKSTTTPAAAKGAAPAAPEAPAEPTVAAPQGVVDTGSTRNATGNRATLDDIAKQVADSRK